MKNILKETTLTLYDYGKMNTIVDMPRSFDAEGHLQLDEILPVINN